MPKIESFLYEGTNNLGILLCHTLAGEPGQMKELAKKLNKKGYTVSCPLYTAHDGSYADIIGTDCTVWYNDVLHAYNELKEKVSGVYVIGMSIGGTFTVKLAQEKDVLGICTINAPIIGFDIESDVFNFTKNTSNEEIIARYREHRTIYFDFVTEVGQIDNLKKITCPLFVLQGSLDLTRYKTSSQLLMYYTNSEIKQRRDYSKSRHLLLLEADKKKAIKDIIAFIEEN